jgi:hypothetical protein
MIRIRRQLSRKFEKTFSNPHSEKLSNQKPKNQRNQKNFTRFFFSFLLPSLSGSREKNTKKRMFSFFVAVLTSAALFTTRACEARPAAPAAMAFTASDAPAIPMTNFTVRVAHDVGPNALSVLFNIEGAPEAAFYIAFTNTDGSPMETVSDVLSNGTPCTMGGILGDTPQWFTWAQYISAAGLGGGQVANKCDVITAFGTSTVGVINVLAATGNPNTSPVSPVDSSNVAAYQPVKFSL